MSWFRHTPVPQRSLADRAYALCDDKDINLIKVVCPETEIDGVKWYDTTGQGVDHEVSYLKMRGILIRHPNNVLVRFRE